jgi:hypothetical protein
MTKFTLFQKELVLEEGAGTCMQKLCLKHTDVDFDYIFEMLSMCYTCTIEQKHPDANHLENSVCVIANGHKGGRPRFVRISISNYSRPATPYVTIAGTPNGLFDYYIRYMIAVKRPYSEASYADINNFLVELEAHKAEMAVTNPNYITIYNCRCKVTQLPYVERQLALKF